MNTNDKLIHLTLTDESARNLMQALDLAVKAGGLNAAILCMEIAKTIDSQLEAKIPIPTENQKSIEE